MIRLSANVSKKVPIPEQEYSSQQYMAGLEVEVGDGATAEQIRGRIAEVYELLNLSIDEEIERRVDGVGGEPPVDGSRRRTDERSGQTERRSDDNRERHSGAKEGYRAGKRPRRNAQATEAQVKAVFAIAKSSGLSRTDLSDLLDRDYGVGKPEELSLREASRLIEELKAGQCV